MATPSLYERSSVPFMLYGNQIERYYPLSKISHVAGGQLDIAPTLFELIAPKGFVYYSLGRSLLAPSSFPNQGLGMNKIITKHYIATPSGDEVEPLAPSAIARQHTADNRELTQAIERHHQARDLSWWIVKKGDNLF